MLGDLADALTGGLENAWVSFRSLNGWVQLGVVASLVTLLGLCISVVIAPLRAAIWLNRERERREDRQVLGDTHKAATGAERSAKKAETAAREEGAATREAMAKENAELKAKLDVLIAKLGAPVAPETEAAFDKAVDEVQTEGDQIEKEALALLAEGKTAEAAARYESDVQQAAGQAIEKLRRKGALFAPVDTFVAKDAYERLLALAPGDLGARNELGHLLMRLGDLPGAEAAYRAVLDGAAGDKAAEAAALGNLGLIAQTRGDLDAAEDFHTRSLKIEEDLGRKEGVANQLGNLGLVALTRSDLNAAKDFLTRSLKIDEDLGRKEGVAATLGNLGNIARARGDLDAAEDFLTRSLKIDEDLGRKEGVAATLGNLGLVAQTRGDLDAAEDFHTRSLKIHEDLGRKEGVAATLGNLGLVAQTRGDLDAAEDFHTRSLKIHE
ncbi:MAG: tetratricopeptide repeat protein, partial [Pseudomonadota bacterium]